MVDEHSATGRFGDGPEAFEGGGDLPEPPPWEPDDEPGLTEYDLGLTDHDQNFTDHDLGMSAAEPGGHGGASSRVPGWASSRVRHC